MDDIRSDISAFHRIDHIEEMDSVRFLKFATRLPAYQGVLAARVMEQQQDGDRTPAPTSAYEPGYPAPTRFNSPDDYYVEPTQQAMKSDPVLRQIISFGTG